MITLGDVKAWVLKVFSKVEEVQEDVTTSLTNIASVSSDVASVASDLTDLATDVTSIVSDVTDLLTAVNALYSLLVTLDTTAVTALVGKMVSVIDDAIDVNLTNTIIENIQDTLVDLAIVKFNSVMGQT